MNISRRTLLRLAAARAVRGSPSPALSLFDGKTLDGWIQIENKPSGGPAWIVKDGAMASTGSGA